jgi:hypothetical protein
MAKDKRTWEKGYTDGYRSIRPGAPISIPPHTITSSSKTDYEWGFERGVCDANKSSN